MTRLYEKALARRSGSVVEKRDGGLTWDDYQSFFSFGGLNYPILQTSMGSVDNEKIVQSATAAYRSNGPVFALTLARLQVFSQPRFQWTRFNGSVAGDLFGTPELAVLERPWHGGTTADLLARMEVNASTAGNSYVRRTRSDKLNLLRPDWVTIALGSQENADNPTEASDVEVAGYFYQPPNGRAQFFYPNEVAHYAPLPDPFFHFLGMSWVTPVLREMQGDALATEHKARFFQNAATPNLAIKFDSAQTVTQVRQFKELLEEDHQGVANAYKTLYLGGGADATTVGLDFRQMDFTAMQGKGESRLASAAGVPPSWVGFSEGLQGSSLNAGNFTSSRRRFSDGTMVHLWTNVAASLESILRVPAGASLTCDLRIPFMREDAGDLAEIQQQEASTITALVRDGFTPGSAVLAVTNNDWKLLVHTGLASVQLMPPSNGTEPFDKNAPTPTPPAGDAGNGDGNAPAK